MSSVPLTTTSYAILGLLDIRDWTAYELAQQATRSLAFVWPVSETQLYAEPKRLERHGLITIRTAPAGPERNRQVLSITGAGRGELRNWLHTPPSAPRLQAEILLRCLLAPSGSTDDLQSALDRTRTALEESLSQGASLVEAYQRGENPFPERLHANLLWMELVRDLHLLLLGWVDMAGHRVDQWTDTASGTGAVDTEEIARLLAPVVDRIANR